MQRLWREVFIATGLEIADFVSEGDLQEGYNAAMGAIAVVYFVVFGWFSLLTPW